VLPLLCLDDFESLLKRTEEFDNGLYENLRSLMNDNALMLVVASHKEVSVYASEFLAIGGKSKTSFDVFTGEFRKVFQNLFLGHSACEIF